jgi:uncharacterized membrane protein YozB (DUF420 family)
MTALPADVDFPLINASLNGVAGLLLIAGYFCVRTRHIRAHAACMLTALAVSTVFLASYLYYHIVVRGGVDTKLRDQWPSEAPDVLRYTYYAILISHVLLAIATVPLALYTVYQGLTGRIARHVPVARWTLPIWLYVSVTGVVVYWMLYRLYATP